MKFFLTTIASECIVAGCKKESRPRSVRVTMKSISRYTVPDPFHTTAADFDKKLPAVNLSYTILY